MLSAQDLHARGVAAINGGRVRAARALLERALERAADEATTGAVEASLAYVVAETGDREAAERLCRSALARDGLTAETRGSLLSQHALLVMLSGRMAEAVRELDAAIAVLGDFPVLLGRAHGNRGTAHLELGDAAAASADFAQTVVLLREAGLPHEAAMAEHNLGYARFLAGDLAGALGAMAAARDVLAATSVVTAAVCDADRAEVLMAAGLTEEGRDALDRAARAYGAARLARRRGEAELTLARSLLLSDARGAAVVARRAARRFERAELASWQRRADAVRVQGELAAAPTATSAVLEEGVRVAEALSADGLRWDAAAVRLAVARSRAEGGDRDGARRLLVRADTAAPAPLSVRLQAREVGAVLARRPADAFGHVRAGLDDLHAWQSSFGSLDLQTNVVGHGVRLAVRGLALAVRSPADTVLFEWSERARMLATRVQPVRAPQDPQTAADLAELRSGPAPEREAVLRRRVREQAWQRRGSGEVADPVELPALQASLGGAALVAYVVTATSVVALVVTADGTTRCELGSRAALDAVLSGLLPDLDMAAAALPAALAGSVRGALAARLDRAAALLVAPLADAVGDRPVVLTPSGVLAGVPWTLLPGLVGRPVTVAQSATSWLARSAEPLRLGAAGLVAGPRVPRAEAEVHAAAAAWSDAEVLAGDAATADAVSALAARVDVLHVAAHGRHTAENPLFSGLELVDGPWFGYDVDQLPGVPDVVLLSACEVGRSSVRWGEELIGLTAAWLHAGARRVVASPAAVNDDAAHDALVRVHAALATGTDPALALAGTVGAVGADAPAPFVCFG
ncbi:CHAT domain-containing protein [Nocardioides anomalus]|uniref:CHAT domain-containing protein n=1 Tax=Nocardioides anomalus TaxID=2712223 RepID=A0A6G6WJD6_9ACTN|nr:CHAT domain-containing protein [Nocardioides anomalus]QIG45205.1 CHAT domain-containing protein [Nocardioides anomalus]